MASIYNTDPNLTYTCLLNLGTTNGVGNTITSSLQTVLDGQGNASGLQISSTGVGFTSATIGNITLNGNTISTILGAISINSFSLVNSIGSTAASTVNVGTGSGSTVNVGTVGSSNINIGAAGSTVTFAGTVSGLSFTSLSTANINIDVTAKTINTTATNGTLTLSGNGTGRVLLGQATSLGVELVADQPLQDSSGNNYISFSKTSTAVNYVTITNQATGTGPTIAANGSDSTVDLFLKPKSTGKVKIGNANLQIPNSDASVSGAALISNASATLSFTAAAVITKVNVQKFTSSGTYTPTTGMVYCKIECVGGGGGSGGSTGSSGCAGGGGGGSGTYSIKTVSAATIGSSQTVTIGAAGAAGTSSGNGGTGGTTSVGSICTAPGGNGSTLAPNSTVIQSSLAPGASGGSAGTGDISIPGAPGFNGLGQYISSSSVGGIGGNGGSNIYGAGGLGAIGASAVVGGAGTGYGSGGGGSCTTSTSVAGAAGAAGLVIITEFLAV